MVTLPVWGHYSTKEINLWLGKSYHISRCDSLLYKNTLSERKPVVQKVLFWPFNGKSGKVSKKKEKSLISIFFDLFYADIPLVFGFACWLFLHLWGGTSLLMAFTFRSYMEFTIACVFFLFSSLFYFPNLVPFFSPLLPCLLNCLVRLGCSGESCIYTARMTSRRRLGQ